MKKYIFMPVMLAISLALSLSVLGLEIRLISGQQKETYTYDINDFYHSSAQINGSQVSINISAKRLAPEKVFLYICKSLSLSDCTKTKPIEYTGAVYSDFSLQDLVSTAGEGRVLAIIKSRLSVTGDLYQIKSGKIQPNAAGSVDIYLSGDSKALSGALSKSGTIPVQFVDAVGFSDHAVQLSVNITEGFAEMTVSKPSKTLISPFSGHTLAFQEYGYSKPLSFSHIKTECGDAVCGIGESYQTCWQDCECPERQVATGSGCIEKSDIRLKIKSIEPKKYKCSIKNSSCRGYPSNILEVKMDTSGTPLNYMINDCFFIFGTTQSRSLSCFGGQTTISPNQSIGRCLGLDECILLIPDLPESRDFASDKSLLLYFPITINAGNRTEKANLTARGNVTVVGQDFFLDVKNALMESDRAMKRGEELAKKIKPIVVFAELYGYYSAWMSVVACAGCSSTGVSCTACGLALTSTLIAVGIKVTGETAIKWCTGKYGGTGSDYMKSLTRTCRDIQEVDNIARQEVAFAENMTKEEIIETFPDLIWANGNVSGDRIPAACNGERVEIKYNFGAYNCSPLKIGFVSNNMTFNSSLEKTNSTETLKSSGTHTFADRAAHEIFSSQNASSLHVRISCNSANFGEIEDTLLLLKYRETCSDIGNLEKEEA